MNEVNLDDLARQFRGRRFAELILEHAKSHDFNTNRAAMSGLLKELPDSVQEPVMDLIDFLIVMPQSHQQQFFQNDCGDALIQTVKVANGFMLKREIELDANQLFTIFNVLVVNWAYACQSNSSTNAAMKKAAGIGFLGRLFGG